VVSQKRILFQNFPQRRIEVIGQDVNEKEYLVQSLDFFFKMTLCPDKEILSSFGVPVQIRNKKKTMREEVSTRSNNVLSTPFVRHQSR